MIIGEIRRYLRDNSAVRVSRSMRDTAYRVLQAREALTAEKAELTSQMNGGTLDYQALQKASTRFGEIGPLLDAMETRWLELSEKEA